MGTGGHGENMGTFFRFMKGISLISLISLSQAGLGFQRGRLNWNLPNLPQEREKREITKTTSLMESLDRQGIGILGRKGRPSSVPLMKVQRHLEDQVRARQGSRLTSSSLRKGGEKVP